MMRSGRAALAAFFCFGLSVPGAGQVSSPSPVASPSPAAKGLQVIYTGNMFGYFRLPDEQKKEDKQCPEGREIESRANEEAKTFFSALPKERGNLVLLGMGENFSPELYSRTITEGAQKQPRDLYYWDFVTNHQFYRDDEKEDGKKDSGPPNYEHLMAEITRGLGRIPVDNVACFFSHAGYTAIVPGKHDFYFGSEYLRYLARLLASPGDIAGYSPVQMLGANLVIQTTIENAPKRIPYRDKTGLKYSDDPGNIKFDLDDGAAVLPWMRKIKVTISKFEPPRAFSEPGFWICPVPKASADPDDANVPGQFRAKHEPCRQLTDPVDGDTALPANPAAGKTLLYPLPAGLTGKDVIYTYLTPGNNYLLCATNVDRKSSLSDKRPYCQHLSVYDPFFNYPFRVPAPGQPLDRTANDMDHPAQGQAYLPEFKNPRPYVVKEVAGDNPQEKTLVAIFGVVDQDLNEHIGKLNYAWLNTEVNSSDLLEEHKSSSTEAKVIDPIVALRQQLEYFQEAEKPLFDTTDPPHPRFRGIKVLLAQMPAYKARRLAVALPGEFNLIIAQAEFEEASPGGTTFVTVPPPQARPLQAGTQTDTRRAPTFIAVPAPFYDGHYKERLRLQVRTSTIKQVARCPAHCADNEEKWSMTTAFMHPPDQAHAEPWTSNDAEVLGGQPPNQVFCDPVMESIVHNAMLNVHYDAGETAKLQLPSPKPTPAPTCDPEKAFAKFQKLALVVMQTQKHADIAMLQKRDFFETFVKSGVTEANLQEVVDRIFWKGDFLLKIPVRGDVLKKIMERSKKYDDEDKASLSLYHESNRGLITLGIFEDRVTSTLIVNGEAVDDNKVYTVATSDYVGLGDTGYSDLLTTPVGSPITPADIKSVQYISGLICREIALANQWKGNEICHAKDIDTTDYFADLQQFPFDTTPGFTPLRHLISWAKIHKRRPALYSSNKVDTLEQSFQQRPVWSLSLSKLAAGFTMNQHNNGTEANVANRFGGITNVPVLSSANSNTTSLDVSLGIQRSSQHLELFEQNDASYSRQLMRQSDPNNTDQASQLKNQMSFEGGVRPRFYPRTKEIPALKGLIALRLETQFSDPLTNFKLDAGGVLPFVGDRTETLLGKYGLRLDNQKSYIEAGYQAGGLISSPVQFVFNPGTTTEVTCSATNASQPLPTCVKNNSGSGGPITASSQVVEVTRNHFVHGLFLTFKMNMPLPGHDKLTYVMESKGQLFFNRGNDVSVETRLYEDWTHSLVVPLFGNFSFVPKVEIIAFQNKVDGHFFWTYQPTLSLQYSLDWHTGLGWKRALQYQNPQVAAKAAQ